MTQSLIERLEKLTGPDRVLDHQIARFVDGKSIDLFEYSYFYSAWDRVHFADGTHSTAAPHYTSSLDAALTLMPIDCTWILGKWLSGCGTGPAVYWCDLHGHEEKQGRHASAAIAVCIAALRARAALEDKERG